MLQKAKNASLYDLTRPLLIINVTKGTELIIKKPEYMSTIILLFFNFYSFSENAIHVYNASSLYPSLFPHPFNSPRTWPTYFNSYPLFITH